MFDIGFSELLLIAVLALLVLGPKRLPEVARTAGRWVARLRRFVTNVKSEFNSELHGEELTELRNLKRELDDTRRAIADSGNRLMQNVADSDRASGGKPNFPHPDDPVTEPFIMPSTASPKRTRAKKATTPDARGGKTAGKHGRRAKSGKRR